MSANAPSTPLLQVAGLNVVLPSGERDEIEAVTAVDLTVADGERIGIVGESGSGKSVTGRAIAGLLPTSPRVRVHGSIRMCGLEMLGASRDAWDTVRSRTVSMVFQDPLTFLNPTMKIGRQVAESVRVHGGMPRADVLAHVHRSLAEAGLDRVEDVAERFPHELSGGMRQRVLIAIALAKQPELIIADEPTTALDATVQRRVAAHTGGGRDRGRGIPHPDLARRRRGGRHDRPDLRHVQRPDRRGRRHRRGAASPAASLHPGARCAACAA
ncbi:ATP-binding cassette domain-containing protein [Microbacterium elymi]|uniref:ABC transporter ATP-binding protein n=1 Tax=Microbacterium elymi TaxID=2909587 RepID=A0ABY5NLZ1_9MICO|nr:ABC transporter ATP-binding protein [Microbacterium elymi]UUT36207.1 ABC transporter ATP-binding protein [Microbacterium elymi]